MSGVGRVESRAFRGPIGASGPVRAFEGLGSYDPRVFLWFLLLDRLVGVSEAWPLRAGQPCPLTEVILIQMGWLTHWVWRF